MKTGFQDRLTATQRARVAPDTGPMTGSSNYQQPSTIRGEAQVGVAALAVASLVVWNMASGLFSFITSGDPPEQRSAQASPTTSSMPTTTSVPTTIGAVIAALQANPDAYGRQHTTSIVDELVLLEQGDAPSERAANLLDNVAEWVANAEVTPATLALLEPVLTPLIASPAVDEVDDGGNGNGNGNGGGNGNGNGNGGGNGNAKGHNKNKNKND
jgi:hypothetical protein